MRTTWGILGSQYIAFETIFEILQRKDSETCHDFRHENQSLCQNMSLEASNPKMIDKNVALNEKNTHLLKVWCNFVHDYGSLLCLLQKAKINNYGQNGTKLGENVIFFIQSNILKYHFEI